MSIQELEKLLYEFIRALIVVFQSREKLSDEVQGEVAQALEDLLSDIEQAKAREALQQQVQQQGEIDSQVAQTMQDIRKKMHSLEVRSE